MVISYSKNLIFLRIPKNASSSVAEYFVHQCDKKQDAWTMLPESGIRENNIPRNTIIRYAYQYQYMHLTLEQIIEEGLLTLEQAKNMKKIVVIRNPFERQISLYLFLCKIQNKLPDPLDFRKEFNSGKHITDITNKYTQLDYIKLKDKLAPNVIFWKYENLSKHTNNKLPSRNISNKPSSMEDLAKLYYDDNTYSAVFEYYKEDIDLYSML